MQQVIFVFRKKIVNNNEISIENNEQNIKLLADFTNSIENHSHATKDFDFPKELKINNL